MKVGSIIKAIEEMNGHPLNSEERLFHGSMDSEVKGVTVCWIASPDAIENAGKRGDGLIIAHESLYFPYELGDARKNNPDWPEWKTNKQPKELLEKYNISLVRIHSSADKFNILDDFAATLGLGQAVYNEYPVKIYEIPETPLSDMLKRVSSSLKLKDFRYSAPQGLEQNIRRIGLPWGGMGLFVNVSYQEKLVKAGVDLLIAGETDNYGFRFSAECGIPMIETSHEISENPGLANYTKALAGKMPELKFNFFENECIWKSFLT